MDRKPRTIHYAGMKIYTVEKKRALTPLKILAIAVTAALVFILLSIFAAGARAASRTASAELKLEGFNLIDIAAGRDPSRKVVHKFGNNTACSTTEEDVWANGGQYQFQIATSVVQIAAGGNAADTAAGAGARKVRIEGLDGSWNEITNDLDTAGASASAVSTSAFIRVNRAYVVDVGTYSNVTASAANVGDITIISTATLNTVAVIKATKGQTQLSMYSVPSGYSAYLLALQLNASATISTTISLYRRSSADDFVSPFPPKRLVAQSDEMRGSDNHSYRVPIQFPEKTDIWGTCLAVSGTPAVTVEYDLVLEKN